MTIQFRSALGSIKVDLEEEEMNELITRYMRPNGLICYDDLCKNLDKVFSNEVNPVAIV